MKNCTLLWLLVCSPFLTFIGAQELVHYDIINPNASSTNYLIDCDDDDCFIALYEYTSQYKVTSLVKIDQYGTELERLLDVSFDGYDINFINHLYERDDEVIIFANANSGENDSKFITFSISKTLETVELIDEIELEDTYLATLSFMYNDDLGKHETFGTIRGNTNGIFLSNFYIDIDMEGNIMSFSEFDIDGEIEVVNSFTQLDSGNYSIGVSGSKILLLDDEFNVISDGILAYALEEQELYDSLLLEPYFTEVFDETLVFVGTSNVGSEYTGAFGLVSVSNDTLVLDSLISILPTDTYDRLYSINATLDNDHNLLTSSIGSYNPGPAVEPNTIYVDKYDSQLNQIWSLDIATATEDELISQNIYVSDNFTVYIVGTYRNSEQIGIQKNFLIIISEEGQIISSDIDIVASNDITLYPNPTTGQINFLGIDDLHIPYRLYNASGILVEIGNLDNLSLEGYPRGIYYVWLDGVRKKIVVI